MILLRFLDYDPPHNSCGYNWDGPYMYWIGRDPWDNWYFFDANYMTRGKMYIVVGSFGPNGKGKNKGKGERDSDDVLIILAPSPR